MNCKMLLVEAGETPAAPAPAQWLTTYYSSATTDVASLGFFSTWKSHATQTDM